MAASDKAGDAAVKKAQKADDAGEAEVQARVDKEESQGFRGEEVDPTPNENYTVAGVTSGAPTPETDDDAYADAKGVLQRGAGKRGR